MDNVSAVMMESMTVAVSVETLVETMEQTMAGLLAAQWVRQMAAQSVESKVARSVTRSVAWKAAEMAETMAAMLVEPLAVSSVVLLVDWSDKTKGMSKVEMMAAHWEMTLGNRSTPYSVGLMEPRLEVMLGLLMAATMVSKSENLKAELTAGC
jgi:hypothetical protein